MKRPIMSAAALLILLAGCATINFQETSPRFAQFNPRSVAILPFTNAMGLEQANDVTNAKLLTALQKKGLFARLVEPGQVKAAMAQNPALLDAITNFRTKWVATGVSEKGLADTICKALNTDSIVFGEISQWGKQSQGLSKLFRAGLNLRWVDKSGEMLWKASHSVQQKGGFLGSIETTMGGVINKIVAVWPKKE